MRLTAQRRSGGKCSDLACLYRNGYVSAGGGGRAYSYDVSGLGDDGYVSGTIDAYSGSRDVSGTLELEDGREVDFEGEWSGKGVVEGYDDDGNYYELEVD